MEAINVANLNEGTPARDNNNTNVRIKQVGKGQNRTNINGIVPS